jgi:hypothetical protein
LKKIVAIPAERAHRDSGSPHAPDAGLCSEAANRRFAKKLTKARESDSILIESLRARANSRMVSLTRSRRETVTFRHPFRIKGIERQLQAGAYEVVTDEELIEGLSFPCFRRVATMIMVPGAPPHHSSIEMLSISSVDLADAQQADAVASR